jgi:hypothetical protein
MRVGSDVDGPLVVAAAVLGAAEAQRRRAFGGVLQAHPVAVADSHLRAAQEGGRSRVDRTAPLTT